MAYLELANICKRFNGVLALDGVGLSVDQGQVLTLLGPSGCGKTTLLRIIAGFEQPSSGRVLLEATDITNVAANRRQMSMVFQAYSLFPNMSVSGNIAFALRLRHVTGPARDRRIDELLELVGLGHARNRYPYQLSGGMQQRVALARALAVEPRVLLLDEPLAALDAKVRLQLRKEIRSIQLRTGVTTVYVTHDQEEAISISDRLAVLAGGKVIQVGSAREVYGSPQTAFVADFIGRSNVLSCLVGSPAEGVLTCQGHSFSADEASRFASGDSVIAIIRPEVLSVVPKGVASTPSRAISGMIQSIEFLGPLTRIGVKTSLGELCADTLTSNSMMLRPGDVVDVSFPSSAVRILPHSDDNYTKAH